MFEQYPFFESYKNYLQVDIVAADADDLLVWRGWVESRLRQLTLMVTSTLFEISDTQEALVPLCLSLYRRKKRR